MFQLFFTGRAIKETLYSKCKVLLMIHLSVNYSILFAYSHFTLFSYCHPFFLGVELIKHHLFWTQLLPDMLKKRVWNEKERIIFILIKNIPLWAFELHNHKRLIQEIILRAFEIMKDIYCSLHLLKFWFFIFSWLS